MNQANYQETLGVREYERKILEKVFKEKIPKISMIFSLKK